MNDFVSQPPFLQTLYMKYLTFSKPKHRIEGLIVVIRTHTVWVCGFQYDLIMQAFALMSH